MATKIEFRNGSVRNNLRVLMQDYVTEPAQPEVKDDKGRVVKQGKPEKKYWKTREISQVVKPQEFGGAYVGSEGTPARMIIEEMPT
jgi:hypothetical protein